MRYIGKFWGWVAGLPLFGIVLITIAAVALRYLFNAPLQWTEEISGLLMIWIVMIGAVAAEHDGQHLTISLLPDALPRRWGLLLNIVVTLFSIVILGYLGHLAWMLAQNAQYKLLQILGISWFWIDIAVTVGAGLMIFYMGWRVAAMIRQLCMSDAKAVALSKHDLTKENVE